MNFKDKIIDMCRKAQDRHHKSLHMIICVLHPKGTKKYINLFSIGVFDEQPINGTDENPIPLKHLKNDEGAEYSIFIFKQVMSLERVKQFLLSYDGQRFLIHNNKNDFMELVDHEFRKPGIYSTKDICERMDNLVPDLNTCCIITEFFATGKGKYSLKKAVNEDVIFDKTFDNLRNEYNIDLNTHSDRLGNFLLIVPETRLYVRFNSSLEHPQELFVNTVIKRPIDTKNLILRIRAEDHPAILDQIEMSPFEEQVIIKDFITDSEIVVDVFNSLEQEVIYRETGTLIQSISTSIGLMTGVRKVMVQDKDGKTIKTEDVELVEKDASVSSIGKKTTRSLIYEKEIEQKKKSLIFDKKLMQYINREHNKAVEDIIEIVNTEAHDYLYLWDPYFSEKEMMEYLPFVKNPSLYIRIITDLTSDHLGKHYKDENEFRSRVEEAIKRLKRSRINNIELRYRKEKGIPFHDRFMITKEKCWMLGSSYNSIGDTHSLIVQIDYPEIIYDEFNRMWEFLIDKRIF